MRQPNQRYYDAMLIKAWREDWSGGRFCHWVRDEFGVWPEELPLLRCKAVIGVMRVRVFVAGDLWKLNERLWECKTDGDFISTLNWLGASGIDCVRDRSAANYRNSVVQNGKNAHERVQKVIDAINARRQLHRRNDSWATAKPGASLRKARG